jgi:XRE family aerobic/anaerobic benzoate catabolism transcriptional regulator
MHQWLAHRRSSRAAGRFIALVGVRFAGKSTVGRLLARTLRTDFVELDWWIEAAAGMPVAEIFPTHGESYYRRLERESLEKLFSISPGCVLEPGGSVVTSGDNWELIKRRCFTVWLHTTTAEHERRQRRACDMSPSQKRTLGPAALKALLKLRSPFYAESQLAIATNGTPAEAVAQIVQVLSQLQPSAPAIEN